MCSALLAGAGSGCIVGSRMELVGGNGRPASNAGTAPSSDAESKRAVLSARSPVLVGRDRESPFPSVP